MDITIPRNNILNIKRKQNKSKYLSKTFLFQLGLRENLHNNIKY